MEKTDNYVLFYDDSMLFNCLDWSCLQLFLPRNGFLLKSISKIWSILNSFSPLGHLISKRIVGRSKIEYHKKS